jgi:hypothetical protein
MKVRLAAGVYADDSDGSVHVDLDEFILGTGRDPSDPVERVKAELAIQRVCSDYGIPYEEAP